MEDQLIRILKEEGVSFVATLPEDPTADLSGKIGKDPYFTFVSVVNENHGIAITAGSALTGRKSVFITGIAGLLVGSWALSMMGQLYRVPMVLLVSYRGDVGDRSGIPGPYLHVFGQVCEPLLKTLQLPFKVAADPKKLESLIHDAFLTAFENSSPVVLLMTEEVLW